MTTALERKPMVKTYANKNKPSEGTEDTRTSQPRKKPRWILVLQKDSVDEKTNSNDMSQYKVVSHKFEVDILFDKIRNDFDLSRFKKLH